MASEVATLGGGCLWCLEAVFEQVKGVEKVESGYCGGPLADPTYKQVCAGTTGHAEVVQVTFDPEAISYREVLEVFFATHDPTTPNRQGHDVGTQYRSAVFTHSPEQKAVAEALVRELDAAQIWPRPIVTEVVPCGRVSCLAFASRPGCRRSVSAMSPRGVSFRSRRAIPKGPRSRLESTRDQRLCTSTKRTCRFGTPKPHRGFTAL